MIDSKNVIATATSKASNITNSVLVLARVAGVTPAKLAEALSDEVKNAQFLAKFTAELVDASLANAIEEATAEVEA